jgi:hypothetical protein
MWNRHRLTSTNRRPRRHTSLRVDALEQRLSLSGFTASRPATYEDPNERSQAVVGAFNPQPDPPTRAGIIAI